MLLVTLDKNPDFSCGLIIEYKTGIFYRNICGGDKHVKMITEGFFVPLNIDYYCEDNFQYKWSQNYKEKEVNYWLTNYELQYIIKARENNDNLLHGEGWVPIRIFNSKLKTIDYFLPNFNNYENKKGIIVYRNGK